MLNLFLPLLLAGTGHADEALRSRVVDMLSGMDSAPAAEQWLALGPAAEAELGAIASDRAMLPTQRANALVALSNFPSEEARGVILATLATPGEQALLRRKAVLSLATGWGASALPQLAPVLADTDPQVRAATVRAIAGLPNGAGAETLRARLTVETDAHVLAELRKAVSL